VTIGEWFEFVNDPEILERIERARRAGRTIYLPRHYNQVAPFATRDADGRYVPRHESHTPVLGISGNDVKDYLAWRNAHAKRRGDRWLWDLPGNVQWEKAARGVDGRAYPWGNRFGVDLCVNMQSRQDLIPEVASRFEPRDESPFGVADMAGSRREWTKDWHLRGGSWGDGERRFFRVSFGDGLGPGYFNWTCGFRPILVENPGGR
jgi:formylglycine-generating enzyme required for sulfatase activity